MHDFFACEAKNFLICCLINHIIFARLFHHFPATHKAAGDDKILAACHGHGIAIRISQDADTVQYLTVFFFSVGDAPFAYITLPDAS